MPNWIPITKANLYDAKVAALVDACDTAALADGQADRSTGIIQGVVNDIRRKIASHRLNRLDMDVTAIPAGLKNLAVDMIIAQLKIAIETDLTEDERNQLVKHERNLNRIANGDDVIEQPDNPLASSEEMQTSGGAEIVRQAARLATRERLDGLI